MARVVRAVVEVGVPDHITEKQLVWKLRHILRYPLQLGVTGNISTMAKAEVKSFSRFMAQERRKIGAGGPQGADAPEEPEEEG